MSAPDLPAAPRTPGGSPAERLGDRIARLRVGLGLTQAELAGRVAISRVALSNLESGRSVPGERTVTLLAGVFHLEPPDLVAGTAYPSSKAERLPDVAARHTELELQLALADRDLTWLEGAPRSVAVRVAADWRARLAELSTSASTPRERELLDAARRRVAAHA
ncbi:MAG: helix-turn-helix transcriptional regulator [Actinobacteria bacterium]|nr:helix-turn-helix transcriptional regulator [Actinomycetota bacterium]